MALFIRIGTGRKNGLGLGSGLFQHNPPNYVVRLLTNDARKPLFVGEAAEPVAAWHERRELMVSGH